MGYWAPAASDQPQWRQVLFSKFNGIRRQNNNFQFPKNNLHFPKNNLQFSTEWSTLPVVMALYVRPLTAEERAELQRLANGDDLICARWAQIILLSASGIGVPKIADTLEISSATVRARIKAFNKQRMEALVRNTSPGRPETISPSLGDKFAALMRERDPRDFGWNDTGWTLDLLVKVATLEGWVESISREGVRLALRKSKHSYRRLKNWTKEKSKDADASLRTSGEIPPS